MKYLVLVVFLVGFACGTEEEVSVQDLEMDLDSDWALEEARQTPVTLDPALIIGNVLGAINNLNTTDINALIKGILGPLAGGLGGATALGGVGAGVSALKGTLAAIVAIISSIIMVPVGIASQILALVGLVLLIIFLIEGNDPAALFTGVARSSSVWPSLSDINYDIVNSPAVEYVSDMFFKAMERWE